MIPSKLEGIINRQQRMDCIIDMIRAEIGFDLDCFGQDMSLEELTPILMQYFENVQVLVDFNFDKRGKSPPFLTQEVLLQDGLYELLCIWEETL